MTMNPSASPAGGRADTLYFPVESCAGVADPDAAAYDRRWFVADPEGRWLSRGRHPELANVEVALRFGTSRAPLREAFRALEREGLIEIFPWRGVCVVQHSLEEIRELFEIRADLLAICVQKITEDGSPEKLAAVRDEIGKLIDLTEAGGDERAYKQQTAAISALTSSLVGNRYLHAMVTDFRQRLLWYYCFLGQSTIERRRESNRLWLEMLDAMQRGDAWAAAKTARQVTLSAARFALQIAEAAEKPRK